MENFKAGYPIVDNKSRFGFLNIEIPLRFSLSNKPTRISYLNSLSEYVDFFVKNDDENSCLLTGNKARELEYQLYDAKKKSNGKKVHILTCGWLASNHCRTTGIMSRRLKFVPHLFMVPTLNEHLKDRNYSKVPKIEGNDLLNKICNVDVNWISMNDYHDNRKAIMKKKGDLIEKDEKNFLYTISEGCADPVGLFGYIESVKEMQEQFTDYFPDHIFVPLGSGGTMSGITFGLELFGLKNTKVWGVCSCYNKEIFQKTIEGLFNKFNKRFKTNIKVPGKKRFEILDEFVGKGYGFPFKEEIQLIKRIAEDEGIIFDLVYGGKTVYAANELVKRGKLRPMNGKANGRKCRVLVINTGGIFDLLTEDQIKYFQKEESI